MSKRVSSVLLIDDDDATNFFNKMVLEDTGLVENVYIAVSGEDALALLKKEGNGKCLQPDIIFLDINMPGMDGWEFIENYKKLEAFQKANIVIVMLTTSLNPDDQTKANAYGLKKFVNKPLTLERFKEIFAEYF